MWVFFYHTNLTTVFQTYGGSVSVLLNAYSKNTQSWAEPHRYMFSYPLSHKNRRPSISCNPQTFSTLHGLQILDTYSTLLYLLPNTKFLFGMICRIPSHSSVLIGSQYREDGKIDTLLLRINTLLTRLEVRPGSCPLRIVDMWIGKPPALSSSVMGHLHSLPFNYSSS